MITSQVIQPIQLPCQKISVGADVIAVGYGITTYGSYADILQYAPMKIVSHVNCTTENPLDSYRLKSICAEGNGQGGCCGGDSGGGLFATATSGTYAVGLISFGSSLTSKCNTQAVGTTDIFKYRDWIKTNAGVFKNC